MPKKAEKTGFGPRLKELREAAGLSQQALADKIGFHRLSVAKLEQSVREPAWSTVKALAEAFGLTCEAFNQPAAPTPPSPRGRPAKAKPAASAAGKPKRPAGGKRAGGAAAKRKEK